MRDTIKILMHAAPSDINRAEVIESIMQVKVSLYDSINQAHYFSHKGVLMVHEMKLWTLTNDKSVVTCHIAIGNVHKIQRKLSFTLI